MKKRFYLFKRGSVFHVRDDATGKHESLRTRDRHEAERLCHAKNEAVSSPGLNLALARVYLSGKDPKLCNRTWHNVFEQYSSVGKPQTQARKIKALKNNVFDAIRSKLLVETTSEDFLNVLKPGGAAVLMHLRCAHNIALGLGWLPWPVLEKKLWPKPRKKQKRGITLEEHQRIVAAERNPEWRVYYEILWEVGAAQTDGANLRAENVDWNSRVLSYRRQKSEEWAYLRIGERLESLLKQLPSTGKLFPKIAPRNDSQRAWHFSKVRDRAGVPKEVTLHSYRYGWAERGRACGYPERWAQNALGHRSKAVHQAYAKGAVAICPPMEEYEKKILTMPIVTCADSQPGVHSIAGDGATSL